MPLIHNSDDYQCLVGEEPLFSAGSTEVINGKGDW